MRKKSHFHLFVQFEPILNKCTRIRYKSIRFKRRQLHRQSGVTKEHLDLRQEEFQPFVAEEDDVEEEPDEDDAVVLAGLFQTLFISGANGWHVVERDVRVFGGVYE